MNGITGDGSGQTIGIVDAYNQPNLLDSTDHRQANSRLSCQLQVTDALDGLKITIAPGKLRAEATARRLAG